ncbi:hypothetical protein [Sinorhizobium medicae]|uniref:hypothetical protein n=1 Tax=Sinorhizobium medicae TaxID=110321 RepID=UPI000FD75878|nr:hypothetical protein [Sinorhizobium medicae]RVJ77337.1 hypothetical protein CN168_19505 [Sinorhizobium medicae]
MTTSAWLLRGYVIVKWLREYQVPLHMIEDQNLRDEYQRFIDRSVAIAVRMKGVAERLSKIEVGPELAAWYEDPGYWVCGGLIAGACAAAAAGDLIGALGLAGAAYDQCGDYLDELERGDKGDGGKDDDGKGR